MIKSFFWNKKWFFWAYGGGLFLIMSLYAQVYMSVLLNEWYGPFYSMLQKAMEHEVGDFWVAIQKFFYIATPYVFLATVTSYFTRLYSLRWREAITFDYIPRWRNVKEEIEGASQRIQEDAYRFARIVETLGLKVVRAAMTLVAFLPILWGLSEMIDIPLEIPFFTSHEKLVFVEGGGAEMIHRYGEYGALTVRYIPGSLVWIAVLATVGGLLISWFVGIKLPGLEYNNQKREAAFRKELVFGEDDKEKYASIPTLTELFVGVRVNYQRLFLHYGYFDIWSNFYDYIMMILSFCVAAPGLFSGAIMLGLVIQIDNAFGKVYGSFSIFINDWTTVTELRSIWKRLHEFEANLDKYKIA